MRFRNWLCRYLGIEALTAIVSAGRKELGLVFEDTHALRKEVLALSEQLARIEKAIVVDIPTRKLAPVRRAQTFEEMEQEALQELEKENTK